MADLPDKILGVGAGSAEKAKAAQIIEKGLNEGKSLEKLLELAKEAGWEPGEGNVRSIVDKLIKNTHDTLISPERKESARGVLNAIQKVEPTAATTIKEGVTAVVEWGKGVATGIIEWGKSTVIPAITKAGQWLAANATPIIIGIAIATAIATYGPSLLSAAGSAIGINQAADDPSNNSWLTGHDATGGGIPANTGSETEQTGDGDNTGSEVGGTAAATPSGGSAPAARVDQTVSGGIDPDTHIGIIDTINGMLDQATQAANSCRTPGINFWQGQLTKLGVPAATRAAQRLNGFKDTCRQVATAAGCTSKQYWDRQRGSCQSIEAEGDHEDKPQVAHTKSRTKIKRTRTVRRKPRRRGRPRGRRRTGPTGGQIAAGIIGAVIGAGIRSRSRGGHSHCGNRDC